MVAKARFSRLLAFLVAACAVTAVPNAAPPRVEFVQISHPGIVAIEMMTISETLAVIFDRASNGSLQIDGHTAWGALYNFYTNEATPLRLTTDTFCATGGFLSNGTMVNVGGNRPPYHPNAADGRMGLRIMEPCDDPTGATCTVFDNPEEIHIVEPRWYPSGVRLYDGSFMVTGGSRDQTAFYNDDPVNSIEFFPPKDGGVPRPFPFLEETLPANLFPRTIALPNGDVFILANNKSILYNPETDTSIPLPDLPNGVRNSNPVDGAIAMLPLYPPTYVPDILSCGGSSVDDRLPWWELSAQDPASTQCSRLTLSPAGIAKGWEVEHMPEGRTLGEFILLPTGEAVLINGMGTGYAAFGSVRDPINGQSNADNPTLTPYVYTPGAPLGQRFTTQLPSSAIPRGYHSSVTLTPKGNLLIGGSNPNGGLNLTFTGVKYPSELRIEYFDPPYMFVDRPVVSNVPKKIGFNENFIVDVDIPAGLNTQDLKVTFIDLGFSTHSFHQSSLVVFCVASLSEDGKKLNITSPPNNRIFPPGPAFVFVTIDEVASTGTKVLLGNGLPPPVADQGMPVELD